MENQLTQYFPNQALAAINELVAVDSWDGFARAFLLGTGKSANTNSTYLTGCRQFYDFTGGLHPMQAGTPEWIEQFYDSLPADLSTRAVKMSALKFMYRRICEKVPFYASPFDAMEPDLKRKLSRSKKDQSEKDALTDREYRGLLRMLDADKSLRGRQDYALLRFGVTSGMRAAELVGLQWQNLSESDGVWKATFSGKGSKVATIEIEAASARSCIRAFRAQYDRKPIGTDYVFNSLPTGRSKGCSVTKSCIHNRLKAISARAKALDIVRGNLAFSTHTLRHTCATRMVAAGVAMDAVMRHLRHSSLSTTQRYLHNSVNIDSVWSGIAGEAAA